MKPLTKVFPKLSIWPLVMLACYLFLPMVGLPGDWAIQSGLLFFTAYWFVYAVALIKEGASVFAVPFLGFCLGNLFLLAHTTTPILIGASIIGGSFIWMIGHYIKLVADFVALDNTD